MPSKTSSPARSLANPGARPGAAAAPRPADRRKPAGEPLPAKARGVRDVPSPDGGSSAFSARADGKSAGRRTRSSGGGSDGTSSRTGRKAAVQAGAARPLAQSDYERLSDFRHALRQFLAFSEQAAKGVGLTPQQHQSLLAIKGAQARGGLSVGDLSRRMLLRHHSVVELVDRLVEAGLVKRGTSEEDARKVMLKLTRRAENVLASLSAAHLEELRRVGPELAAQIAGVSGRDAALR